MQILTLPYTKPLVAWDTFEKGLQRLQNLRISQSIGDPIY
jgi:hypothetical protein